MRFFFSALLLCLISATAFAPRAYAQEASMDNLPLPRWAVIAVDEINLRTGPGKRYPIDWVIKKKGLPVEVTQEFDTWRLIHEPGGSSGWVNKTMMSSVRNVMVQSNQSLLTKPESSAHVAAQLQKGVIGRAVTCTTDWCRLKIQHYEGWVPKDTLWGVYPKEVFE